tara:strand:- start:5578 stop:6528 length:951 start_codon:yes stop_codon:yes gene_type:complete
MQYFGIINKEDFSDLDKDLQYEILSKKGIFENVHSIALSNELKPIIGTNENMVSRVIKEVELELYEYTLRINKGLINSVFTDYFFNFNEYISGMKKRKARKIALDNFKTLTDLIVTDNIKIGHVHTNRYGIQHQKNAGKFETLHGQQNALKEQLAESELLIEYLYGNESFFTKEPANHNELISQIMDFESILKILVSLNDQFHFEDDYIFSGLGILKSKYNSIYLPLFKNFAAFRFTYETISDFNKYQNAQVEALYTAILDLELIKKNKSDFMYFVNSEFNFSITKIRSYEEGKNYTHEERVSDFKADWIKFSDQK